MRDLAFWGALFEATRPLRMDLAAQLIDEMYAGHQQLQVSLKFSMQGVALYYQQRNAQHIDPAQAEWIERQQSPTGEPSERYLAARGEAEAFMCTLTEVAA